MLNVHVRPRIDVDVEFAVNLSEAHTGAERGRAVVPEQPKADILAGLKSRISMMLAVRRFGIGECARIRRMCECDSMMP